MDAHLDASSGGLATRLDVLMGPSGRLHRSEPERARIAAESLMPGVRVVDLARKHGTTRWQIYNWRKKLQSGELAVPESVAALPVFAELLLEMAPAEASVPSTPAEIEIVVGDVVIRSGVRTDEQHLTLVIRAARASAP